MENEHFGIAIVEMMVEIFITLEKLFRLLDLSQWLIIQLALNLILSKRIPLSPRDSLL